EIVPIVPDLHIIEQIRGVNVYDAKHKQVVSKKVKYANRFGKMKKALNIALDLGCEEELINMVIRFIDQKKSITENINNESAQPEHKVIMDPLVTKHCGRPPTKRLKSSSEHQGHRELACNQAINLQDSNLRLPFSNISPNGNNVLDNNAKEL
ncbi:6532_t:CDS:1, partial [Racocetra fulgida]